MQRPKMNLSDGNSDMPNVKLHLFAGLRAYAGGAASVEVEVAPGEPLREVLVRLGIPPEKTRIIFVNHRAADLDHALAGGDEVALFPAIGGG